MKTNIIFIKFFSTASIITLVLSLVSYIIKFDFKWISDEFLFTMLSGIFVSFLVVLISEIKHYYVNKRATEDVIYNTCVGVYIELTGQIRLIEMYLNDKTAAVHGATLENRLPFLTGYSNSLRSIDYTTFDKRNAISIRYHTYVNSEFPSLSTHIGMCNYLPIAVNQSNIQYLQRGYQPPILTSAEPLINTALQKIKANAVARRTAAEGMIESLVSFYPQRFPWESDKMHINAMYMDTQQMNREHDAFFQN